MKPTFLSLIVLSFCLLECIHAHVSVSIGMCVILQKHHIVAIVNAPKQSDVKSTEYLEEKILSPCKFLSTECDKYVYNTKD